MQTDNEQNSKKLEQIYNLYAKKLLGFAYTYFHNQYDAEDAVAAAFVKLADRLDMVDDPESAQTRSLLMVITKNICINVLRERKKVSYLEDVNYNDSIASDENVFDNIELNETKEQIIKAICSLNDIYKDVLTLMYVNNLDIARIADTLDISYHTAQKRIKRGEKLLIEILKEKGVL
ncbi:MAG: sigma-70 family RNA polymerase sigma factor [Clostridiales bacterium]|nr:sigma-70 family RNA polymerase sigma factor [Clostridiales bacterium]